MSRTDAHDAAPPSPMTMAQVKRRLARGESLLRSDTQLWWARLHSLADALAVVEDPRDNRGLRHPLVSVLAIAVLGCMCGANDAEHMNLWALRNKQWLQRFLPLPYGIPSQDTILRVLAAVDPRSFRRAFCTWVDTVLGSNFAVGEQLCVDGKTSRGSGDRATGQAPTHMVSALVASRNLVIGQVATESKSNEITAIPELLKMLSIRQALVSIDAMGCQVKIAQLICAKQADYLLAIKANQGTLHDQVILAFEHVHAGAPRSVDAAQPLSALTTSSTDGGHGRIEERTIWVIHRSSDPQRFDRWLPASKRWPELAAIVCIREVQTDSISGEVSEEMRYFISSRELEAEDALSAVRSHWAIENGLHWVLDVTFGEDQSRVRSENASENLAVVRHLAHGILRRHRADKVSVAKRRTLCAMWPAYIEFVLGSPEPQTPENHD